MMIVLPAGFEIRRDAETGFVPCVVVGRVGSTRSWTIVVGVGVGHLSGGELQTWAEEDLPWDVRFPNAKFWFGRRP